MRLQENLRRPSSLIVQEREEFPFRIELGGGTELGQHLASDAMDAHARPLRAFAIARIGDLPEERHHAQLLQENGIERHLVQPVENLRGRARRFVAIDRIDLNENSVPRLALSNEGGDRRITGIAAVPIRFAVDLYGLEHGGQTGRGKQNVRRNGAVFKHMTAASPDIGGGDEKLYGRLRQPLEIDEIGQPAEVPEIPSISSQGSSSKRSRTP
jgi:hypothetical protein